jgi:hypothetical protein
MLRGGPFQRETVAGNFLHSPLRFVDLVPQLDVLVRFLIQQVLYLEKSFSIS